MKNKPKVSVILPNYNHGLYLQKRLESIFNQTYQDFEVIILDDSSTDNSIDILKKHSSHIRVSHFEVNEVNSGSTFRQWDKGIRLAKGEFIWIAESDDFCESTFLEEIMKPFQEDSKIALSYCQSHRVNSLGEIRGNWISHTYSKNENPFLKDFTMDGNLFIEKYLIHKNVIPNVSAAIFKKQHLEQILPLNFNSFMRYNADWYFYIKILCNSKVSFVSKTLNSFRYHDKSVIAKAEEENGKVEIYKMEILGRKKMLKFLKRCNPPNILRIEEQLKIGNEALHFLRAKEFVYRGNILKALYEVIGNSIMLKKIIRYAVQQYKLKWRQSQ